MSSHLSPAAQARHRIPRIAEAAVERARLTVVPRRRTRAARMPFVALVSALLVGGVVGLLLFNTSMQQASFASTALEEQATALTAREQTLKMDLEQLRDPQTLAVKAKEIGMVPAPPPCFLRMGSGKVEGTCTPASAADDLAIAEAPPTKPAVLSPDPIVKQLPDDTGSDTGRGDGRSGGAGGRTGHQQSPNQSQDNPENHAQNEQRGNR